MSQLKKVSEKRVKELQKEQKETSCERLEDSKREQMRESAALQESQ